MIAYTTLQLCCRRYDLLYIDKIGAFFLKAARTGSPHCLVL